MDGTIPTLIGQWIVDTGTTVLTWPGQFGWGVLAGAVGPNAWRWLGKKLPGAVRKR